MKVSTYIFKFVSDGLELKHEQILSNEQSLDPVEKCLQVIQNIDALENISQSRSGAFGNILRDKPSALMLENKVFYLL